MTGLALSGCEGDAGAGSAAQPRIVVPAFVQKMVDADFPADGQIHVQSVGKFEIKPDTIFCIFRPGYGLDNKQLKRALERIGQKSAYRDSHTAGVDKECAGGSPVFVRSAHANNRIGAPYKLTLAIWQDVSADWRESDAAWVGGVKRINAVRPRIAPLTHDISLYDERQKQLQDESIEQDVFELSKLFFTVMPGAKHD
jgi:hypothetical protein